MDFFKRIGALASYLDDELHRIEAQYRIFLESGRRYENCADVVYEIREVSKNKNLVFITELEGNETNYFVYCRKFGNWTSLWIS